ncbi:MAG: DUF1549 domain-containing protein, partial [Verrucomicrobiales bacterium]|nr:DUF1549 domain-containing protein [Verrucomicrobiales bacterium]
MHPRSVPGRRAGIRAWVLALFVLAGHAALGAAAADVSTGGVPSFRNDVVPVLSQAGCNSGGCHGALAGKGGFRLSLFGYDPEADYRAITRESRGRRVEVADPARSLLLTKPTAALKHKGGKRFDVDSEEYRILAAWIAADCPPPRADDPVLTELKVLPDRARLEAGRKVSLAVEAVFGDGSRRDVTRWTRFASADETVASVDRAGNVTVLGPGEGAVTAWFSSRIALSRITAPFPHAVSEVAGAAFPVANPVDEWVNEKLRQLNLRPSPPASDGVFVRRAFLDTIGKLPTPEEVLAFVRDTSPRKHERLADQLLARPEYIDYWTYKWSDLLLVSGAKLRPDAVDAYYRWIRDRVAENTPWDAFVRALVTVRGSSIDEGASNFYAVHQDPESMAENVSQAFLGLSIGCARCHNHPLEKWTNDQYYAFANLFARVRAKGWGGDARNGDGRRTLYVEP